MRPYTHAEVDAMMLDIITEFAGETERLNQQLAEASHLDRHGVTIAEAEAWTSPAMYEDSTHDHLTHDVYACDLSGDSTITPEGAR